MQIAAGTKVKITLWWQSRVADFLNTLRAHWKLIAMFIMLILADTVTTLTAVSWGASESNPAQAQLMTSSLAFASAVKWLLAIDLMLLTCFFRKVMILRMVTFALGIVVVINVLAIAKFIATGEWSGGSTSWTEFILWIAVIVIVAAPIALLSDAKGRAKAMRILRKAWSIVRW